MRRIEELQAHIDALEDRLEDIEHEIDKVYDPQGLLDLEIEEIEEQISESKEERKRIEAAPALLWL